jgi:hypothetical protein
MVKKEVIKRGNEYFEITIYTGKDKNKIPFSPYFYKYSQNYNPLQVKDITKYFIKNTSKTNYS